MQLNPGEKIEELMIEDYKIIQSEKLYRFTSDAVLLSRFAVAKKGDRVADICSGSGIVGLHFYALGGKKIKSVALFEIQKELAEMSERSVELNDLGGVFTVYNTPIQQIDKSLNGAFSLVLCNPPYNKVQSGLESTEPIEIAMCKNEISVTLEEICKTASRLLCSGGRFCMCHRAERLADVIIALNNSGLSASRLKLVSGSEGSKPYLLLIEAVKGGNPQLKTEATCINSARDFSGETAK